ncbi:hypothetical protein MMC25_001835 [Agyrium rufum]|nr:hypothetical protein [Agyrium rufum]
MTTPEHEFNTASSAATPSPSADTTQPPEPIQHAPHTPPPEPTGNFEKAGSTDKHDSTNIANFENSPPQSPSQPPEVLPSTDPERAYPSPAQRPLSPHSHVSQHTHRSRSQNSHSPTPTPWGPQHPCYPHPNPHLPLSSPLHPLTRVIRIPRDWLAAGDLAPQFSQVYPEILTSWISEVEFRSLIEEINAKLKEAYDPWAWANWIDGLFGLATGWLWEDLKIGVSVTHGRRGIKAVQNFIENWNGEKRREWQKKRDAGGERNVQDELGEEELVTVVDLRRTGFLSIDIAGLTITILPTQTAQPKHDNKVKSKAKAKADGLEILSQAELRFKPGKHYAFVGRNGTGKSTVLRAVAKKLIPGILPSTKISILQQTAAEPPGVLKDEAMDAAGVSTKGVMEFIIESNLERERLVHEARVLSEAVEDVNNPLAAVRAVRKLRYQKMEKDLFEAQKIAQLRSGARGYDARKDLIVSENKLEEYDQLLHEEDDGIDSETIANDTDAAVNMLASIQSQLGNTRVEDIEKTARLILGGLGFTEKYIQKKYNELSGGWRMRTMLAAALTHPCDILLLDEPTNYLDLLGIIWLQHYLSDMSFTSPKTTIIVVTHDRDFVNAICSELILLKDKKLTYFSGNLASYEKDQRHQTLRLSRMQAAQDKQKAHFEKTIINNMRQGKKNGDEAKIRQAKSRQKRIEDRMGMTNANGTRWRLNDKSGYFNTVRDAIVVPEEERSVIMIFPPAAELRNEASLVSLEKCSFFYNVDLKARATPKTRTTVITSGKNTLTIHAPTPAPKLASSTTSSTSISKATKPTLHGITLVIHPRSRTAIVGLNGSGKTTLLNLLVGETQPTSGIITRHPRLKLGYYSQTEVETLQALGAAEPHLTALGLIMRDSLAPGDGTDSGLVPTITAEAGERSSGSAEEGKARALLSGMGLIGATASNVPIAKLSGGQLARLGLARIMIDAPHLLVLDEVTTHLDFYTVDALITALREWEGAILLVTHDRYLVRKVIEGGKDEDDNDDSVSDGDSSDEGVSGIIGVGGVAGKVYELKGGTLVERGGGMTDFEESLEGRLKRMGL